MNAFSLFILLSVLEHSSSFYSDFKPEKSVMGICLNLAFGFCLEHKWNHVYLNRGLVTTLALGNKYIQAIKLVFYCKIFIVQCKVDS